MPRHHLAAMVTFSATDEVVHLVADEGKGATFGIHYGLLLDSSPYFRHCVLVRDPEIQSFRDNNEGMPLVLDVKVPSEAMATFTQWLYTGQVSVNGSQFAKLEDVLSVYKWTGCYLSNADFRDALVDEAIRMLISTTAEALLPAMLEYLNETSEGGMQMLVTDCIVYARLNDTGLYAEINERIARSQNSDVVYRILAQGFLELKTIEGQTRNELPWVVNPCQYHEHAPNETCSENHIFPQRAPPLETPRPEPLQIPPAPRKRKMTGTTLKWARIEVEDEACEPDGLLVKKRRSPHKNRPRPDEEADIDGTIVVARSRMTQAEKRTEDEIVFGRELPTARVKRAPWTNKERISLLKVVTSHPTASQGTTVSMHNATFWSESGKGVVRSGKSCSNEFANVMGTPFGYKKDIVAAIHAKIAELEDTEC